jgi:hypothetical protein
LGVAAQAAKLASKLDMKPLEQPETDQADANQINRDHEIKQPRHDQNQDARDQGHERGNMGGGDRHQNVSDMTGTRSAKAPAAWDEIMHALNIRERDRTQNRFPPRVKPGGVLLPIVWKNLKSRK